MTIHAWLDPAFLVTGFSGSRNFSFFPNWDSNSEPDFHGSPDVGQAVSQQIVTSLGFPWVIGGGLGEGTTTQFFVGAARWEILRDDLPYYAVGFTPEPIPLNQWLFMEFGNGDYFFWVIDLAFNIPLEVHATRPKLPPTVTTMASSTSINFDTWGQTIPYSYGARRLDGFKIWAKGIESSDQTLDGLAYATWADSYGYPLILGEDIYVNRIWFDGLLVWTLADGVQVDTLGDTLNFRVYTGTEDQLPDPDIVADKGATRTPGFRRQIYVIFFDVPLTAVGNRFPSTSVEILRTDGARINVSDALEAVGELGGVATQCEGIDDQADGVVFNGLSPRTVFATYRDQYSFRIVDGDPVRLVRRAVNDDLTVDATLATSDLITAKADDDVVTVTRQDDNALANQIEITYNDKAINYQQGQQQFRRQQQPIAVSTSHVIQRITTDFIVTATEAIGICADMLARIWARKINLKFTAAPALGEIEESDILVVPTSQATFTVDVTRRTVLPDNSVQIEADFLQAVRGANLFADSGSILGNALRSIPVPQQLVVGQDRNILVDNGYIYAQAYDATLGYGIVRWSTSLPTKLSISNFIAYSSVVASGVGDSLSGQFSGLIEDDSYVYALVEVTHNSVFQTAVVRVDKSDFTNYDVLFTGQALPFASNEALPAGNSSSYGGIVIAGDYMVWLCDANNVPYSAFDPDGTQATAIRMVKINVASFDAAGVSITTLDTPPAGQYWSAAGACSGDGVALFTVTKGTGYWQHEPTDTRIYRFESWTGTVTHADFAGVVLGRGVYVNGNGYFLPAVFYHTSVIATDGGFYLDNDNFTGARVSADLSTITTFDVQDDPNVVGNARVEQPYTDGTFLYYVCNQHFYPPGSAAQDGFTFVVHNYLLPYLARRRLDDLTADGMDLSPFMDSSSYLMMQGARDSTYHYIIGHVFGGTDPVSHEPYGGALKVGINGAATVILKVIGTFTTASFFPAIQPAAGNDAFAGFSVALNATVTANNEFATKQTGEPDHAGDAGGRSLWWTFNPPATGYYQLTTGDPPTKTKSGTPIIYTFPETLAVYTGVSLTSLTAQLEVSGVNNLPGRTELPYWSAIILPLIFGADAGVKSYIAVDGHFNSVTQEASFGNVSFRIENVTLDPNDAFANALPLQAGSFVAGVNNRYATKESGEPDHAGNPGGKSVWYKFVAPHDGLFQLDISRSNFAAIVGVYTGSNVASLSEVASYDNPNAPTQDDEAPTNGGVF
jgi:hypothetical protein